MSATIGINKSKFVIFGSGHDYTLADSGEGEKMFFSHPFMPKGAENYASQYLIYCPIYDPNDETAEPVITDVVKDDIAHCEFTPALGTAFNTTGEQTVKIHYRREYIYPESTILVEKELEQTITVVNHGLVVDNARYMGNTGHYYRRDIYADGYCFIRPMSTYEFPDYYCLTPWESTPISKVSSIPWRATSLGDGIYGFGCGGNVDISELAYADVSRVTYMYGVFGHAYSSDWSAIENWDVSSLVELHYFAEYSGLTDLSVLSKWNTSSLTDMKDAFVYMSMESLDGLEDWDVSGVTNMQSIFANCQSLKDISALADWDVSSVTNMNYMFIGDVGLLSLVGLEDWDVSNVVNLVGTFKNCQAIASVEPLTNWNPKPTSLYETFMNCYKIQSTDGLEGFDTTDCTNFGEAFFGCKKLRDIDALGNWVVSKGTDFSSMFAWDYWISDISMLNEWDFSSALNLGSMFLYVSALLSMDDIDLDLSNVTTLTGMFTTHVFGAMTGVGDVFEENSYYYDYNGNAYSVIGTSITPYTKDASNAENWDVNGTGLGAFDSNWSNRPSWN